jgi:hypothetical protein
MPPKPTEKIIRFLKTTGYRLWQPVRWMDEHHGFMTFLATVVIGGLTVSGKMGVRKMGVRELFS